MFFRTINSEKKGKEILKNFYYFSENQMLDCNQYCMYDENTDEISLFDAGNGFSLPGLFKGMENLGLDYNKITKVFLTHEHVDHVIGLYTLFKKLNNPSLKIYAYGETANILREGNESKIFPGNLGISAKMFGIDIFPLEIKDLTKINEIKIGSDFHFQIHYTPGHSLGSISYYEPSKKILIPGDLVFTGGSFGRFDFPGSSLKSLQDSIKHVKELDVSYLLPGHMDISDKGNQQIEYSYRMVQSIDNYY